MTERSGYAETVTVEQLFDENQQLKKRNAELEQTGGMVSKAAVVEKLLAINAGRLKEVPKDISTTSANIVLYKTDAVEEAIKAIEAMPCSDDKLVEITVVGERCIYINDTRVVGGKPYISENIPQHSFEVKASVIIEAIKDKGAR